MSDQATTPPPPPPPPGPAQPAFPATSPPPPPGARPPVDPALLLQPEAETKRKNKRAFIFRFVAVPFVVLVGGIVWSVATGDPENAQTGDCLVGQNADDMKIVGCDDAKAEWTVVGKVEKVRQEDFNASQDDTHCTAYPSATASLWSGTKNANGDVLCLEPVKK